MPQETRVALVTGGARRIGRAIVERLAKSGFDVAFTFHSSQPQAQELVTSLGGKTLAIDADLTEPQAACTHILDLFLQSFGRLDVLVNNASIYQRGGLSDTNPQTIRRLNAIHVESPLLLCKAFESHLRQSSGHIINMIDLLAERPWPQYMAYCASKAALANLTMSLAAEFAPQVTVNGISPGVVQWPDDYPQAEREKYLKRVPLNRSGTPQDVANLVHFLATEGGYITGQIIRVDGGRSIT